MVNAKSRSLAPAQPGESSRGAGAVAAGFASCGGVWGGSGGAQPLAANSGDISGTAAAWASKGKVDEARCVAQVSNTLLCLGLAARPHVINLRNN